jgi:hypothetical protein
MKQSEKLAPWVRSDSTIDLEFDDQMLTFMIA